MGGIRPDLNSWPRGCCKFIRFERGAGKEVNRDIAIVHGNYRGGERRMVY